VPIGACLAQGAAARILGAGQHGSTFGGNPLVCAAGLAVIDTIARDHLCDNAAAMGQLITDTLRAELGDKMGDNARVREIRGKGLMLGIQLHRDCGELVERGLDAGLLINVAGGNTVRLLPPLVINAKEARELAVGVAALIRNFH
jgi:acetylornithine aminotransferase